MSSIWAKCNKHKVMCEDHHCPRCEEDTLRDDMLWALKLALTTLEDPLCGLFPGKFPLLEEIKKVIAKA
jgi:hypothetical protein